MATRTVGPGGDFPTIAAALITAGPLDIIELLAGYSNETATVNVNLITVLAGSSSTGITLQLANNVNIFNVSGTASFRILDSGASQSIFGGAGDDIITVSGGNDIVSGGFGFDRLVVDYRDATGAVTGILGGGLGFSEAGGGGRSVIAAFPLDIEAVTFLTGAGDDNLTLGDGDDVIDVGGGNNSVNGAGGNNTITSGSGNDTLTGGDGNNSFFAGDGNNTLTTGNGNDTITAGRGNNTINTNGGDDSVSIGGGNSTTNLGAGFDRLTLDYSSLGTSFLGGVNSGSLAAGYAGQVTDAGSNSVAFTGTEAFTITFGTGNDQFTGGDGDDILGGGAGRDTLTGQGGQDQLFGGAGDDQLNGGEGNDQLQGGEGGDQLAGGNGDDVYLIEDVADVIVEGPGGGLDTAFVVVDGWTNFLNVEIARLANGATRLFGSSGAEDLVGNISLASTIDGQGGDDVIWGTAFNDVLNGNAGNDIIRGQGADDQMFGGTGNDQFVVFGNGSVVTENAGEGTDILYYVGSGSFTLGANIEEARLSSLGTGLVGSSGAELLVANNLGLGSTINGAGGNDTIYGDVGNDTIKGGAGDDTLYNLGGADTYVYDAAGWGFDKISTLTPGSRIQFTAGSGVSQFSDLAIATGDGNSLINHAGGTIMVFGTTSLTASDFLFG